MVWDFSWYTQAGPGEAYADLGIALDQAVERGFNIVRICAAPLLLYGGLGLDYLSSDLPIEGVGQRGDESYYGCGTRWYNTPGGFCVDVRHRLFELLDGIRSRGLRVILSSWEYQQSTAFCADPRWCETIMAIPLDARPMVLAHARERLWREICSSGLAGTIAFTELHNEIDFSHVPWDIGPTLAHLHTFDSLGTASYGNVWKVTDTLPDTLAVAQFHVYAYGVLDVLQKATGIRECDSPDFPNALLRSLQRPDAPTLRDYGRPTDWKFRATVLTNQQFYAYDTVDGTVWDAWLDDHYPRYREEMHQTIQGRLKRAADWGLAHGVPVVVGESWIGYTPLGSNFEDGPCGKELAEYGMDVAKDLGMWGATPCSNAAPHHPMWVQREWLTTINARFLSR